MKMTKKQAEMVKICVESDGMSPLIKCSECPYTDDCLDADEQRNEEALGLANEALEFGVK